MTLNGVHIIDDARSTTRQRFAAFERARVNAIKLARPRPDGRFS